MEMYTMRLLIKYGLRIVIIKFMIAHLPLTLVIC